VLKKLISGERCEAAATTAAAVFGPSAGAGPVCEIACVTAVVVGSWVSRDEADHGLPRAMGGL
jgi:hypothetical protein